MPTTLKGAVIVGIGFAIGVAIANVLVGTAVRGLKG